MFSSIKSLFFIKKATDILSVALSLAKENNIDAYKNKLCVSKATLTETCQVFRTNKRVNFYIHTELGVL